MFMYSISIHVIGRDLDPESDTSRALFNRPYRAPELLFGPLTYDALATDLWSLGAMFAEFFTPLRLTRSDEDDEDDDNDSNSTPETSKNNVKPFIIPSTSTLRPGDPTAQWRRDTLFNADRGEIGLAWSIFRIRGTPNDDTWPVRLPHYTYFSATSRLTIPFQNRHLEICQTRRK